MTSIAGWLSPTRTIGLIAYAFAAICCGIAWARSSGTPHPSRLAAVLALLEAGLFLDMAFSVRWHLHDLIEAEAIRKNIYAQRVGPQLAALGLLSVAATAGMGLALQRLRGRPGTILAVCSALLSLSLWCAEVISLHATDRVLHHAVGKVMMVGLCWFACSTMTGMGILWDNRATRSRNGPGHRTGQRARRTRAGAEMRAVARNPRHN